MKEECIAETRDWRRGTRGKRCVKEYG